MEQGAAPREKRIFLSYGRKDAVDIASRLRADLTQEGFSVFQDIAYPPRGQPFDDRIEAALDGTHAVLALLSPHAVRRADSSADGLDSFCLDELAKARELRKPIIPIIVAPCEIPTQVSRHERLDFRGWRDADHYEALLNQLTATLDELFAGGPAVRDGRLRGWDFSAFVKEKTAQFHGRDWLFAAIDAWAHGPSEGALLVLGDPGIGKSAMIAELVRRNPGGAVLAHHFCQADTPATLDVARFVRSLVAQVAAADPAYADRADAPDIADLLRPGATENDPASAFEAAVLAPLAALPAPGGYRLLLIDGLDEALAQSAGARVTIPELVAPRLERLPRWLRLVATSRREPTILRRFAAARAEQLDADDARNLADVGAFVRTRLAAPALQERLAQGNVSAESAAAALARHSAGSFLYARQTLQALERAEYDASDLAALPRGLGELYARFFRRSWPGDDAYRPVRRVLEVMIAARQPLDDRQILRITGLERGGEVGRIMESLAGFVARGPRSVTLYHKSLVDWLVDPEAGEPRYRIDRAAGEARLTAYCRRWAELDDEYPLQHLPGHLLAGGHLDELQALLTAGDFLRLKAAHAGAAADAAADFAALAAGLAAAGRDADLVSLLASDDPRRADAVVAALERAGIGRERMAAMVTALLRVAGALAPAAALVARQAALRLAASAGLVDVLAGLAEHADPALRLMTVPCTYRMWQENRAHGWDVAGRLRRRAVGFAGWPRTRALDSFGGISLAILSRDFADDAAMRWLRDEWRQLVQDFARAPVMRIVARRWVLSAMAHALGRLMARQPDYQPLNLREMAASAARPPEFHRHTRAVAEHLVRPELAIEGVESILLQRDLPFDLQLMLAAERALILRGVADPPRALAVLDTLHRDGCPWFRQSNLYVAFHVLKRTAQVDDAMLERYAAMTIETIDATRATFTTAVGEYRLVPHMAWAELIFAQHRRARPRFIPQFFARAREAGDQAYARRVLDAAQVLSFAYRADRLALEALRPAVEADDPHLADALVAVLANIRFAGATAVEDFLVEDLGRRDLAARVAAAGPSVRAADFPTWVDEFFIHLLLESEAFRREVAEAFMRSTAARNIADLLGEVLVWVMNLLAGEKLVRRA